MPDHPGRFAPMRPVLSKMLGASLIVSAALAGGCYTEGGIGYSLDQATYISTPWRPWTITLKDTRTGQDFWSVDVPVGKQLSLGFVSGDSKDPFTPDVMNWAIMDAGEEFGRLGNSLPVPGRDARRLDASLRPAPELPDGMTPTKRPPTLKRSGAASAAGGQ